MSKGYQAGLAVRRTNLVDEVISAINRMIATHAYRPGDRLPSEAELARTLGIGRSTLREAIRVLSHLGVVEARNGVGTYVTADGPRDVGVETDSSVADIRQAQQYRYCIELPCARLAALHRTDLQMASIREAWDACVHNAKADDYEEFSRLDYKFHALIVEASGNKFFVKAHRYAAPSIEHASEMLLRMGSLQYMVHFHDELIDAIQNREPSVAAAAVTNDFKEIFIRLGLVAPGEALDLLD
jgi:GntR family transcriptional regulator, transcriptional repressor for pyruvate dehydrogenase complex